MTSHDTPTRGEAADIITEVVTMKLIPPHRADELPAPVHDFGEASRGLLVGLLLFEPDDTVQAARAVHRGGDDGDAFFACAYAHGKALPAAWKAVPYRAYTGVACLEDDVKRGRRYGLIGALAERGAFAALEAMVDAELDVDPASGGGMAAAAAGVRRVLGRDHLRRRLAAERCRDGHGLGVDDEVIGTWMTLVDPCGFVERLGVRATNAARGEAKAMVLNVRGRRPAARRGDVLRRCRATRLRPGPPARGVDGGADPGHPEAPRAARPLLGHSNRPPDRRLHPACPGRGGGMRPGAVRVRFDG